MVSGTINLSLSFENPRWKSQCVFSNQETETQEIEVPVRSEGPDPLPRVS